MQDVEEERRQRDRRAAAAAVVARAGTRCPGTAAAVRPRAARSASPSRHRGRTGSALSRGDHLGQPGRDVVQRAGEQPDRRRRTVHLDPDPVELPLHRGRARRPWPGPRRRWARWRRASAGPGGRPPGRTRPAPRSRRTAPRRRPRRSEPRSIMARRTSAAGTAAARATASIITPSSAPWRSSPESRPTRNRCSPAVARPNSSPTSALRAAAEPFPDTAPIASNPELTSDKVSVGVSAGANPSRRAAQPTPICRCGSSPDRYATATGTSSGPAARSAPASASILASRALVPATVRDTAAISVSSTRPLCPASDGAQLCRPPPRRPSRRPGPRRPVLCGAQSQYPTGNSRMCR